MRLFPGAPIFLVLFVAGCVTVEKSTPAPELAPPAAVVKEAPAAVEAALPPVPEDVFEPQLLPEDLRGKLGVRDYAFSREGGKATLSLTLDNQLVDEPIALELAARFVDGEGNAVLQTDWVRATVLPQKRCPYTAQTVDLRVVSGRVLVRLVETKK